MKDERQDNNGRGTYYDGISCKFVCKKTYTRVNKLTVDRLSIEITDKNCKEEEKIYYDRFLKAKR